MSSIQRIAVLTRDCAGVNAAIRSVVRTAVDEQMSVFGVMKGYEGLIDGSFISLDRRSVSGILNQGGTMLKTARSKRFYTDEGQQQAIDQLHDHKIDAVIVIGGNGSLSGAFALASKSDIAVMGIPATIDNDVPGVSLSLGSDTALNVAMDAVDKIRDTATSLERIFVVEVMGRKSGYIALKVALAGGCEEVLLPEQSFSVERMSDEILKGSKEGKQSWIIVVAEGAAKADEIADQITAKTGLETRVTVLGHIQRGGRPTAVDRVLAARLGHHTVSLLARGVKNKIVHANDGKLDFFSLDRISESKSLPVSEEYKLVKTLL
ncbi:MAG: ATP-dependent 6-phosphofructokinase [Thermoplasmatota archaeon]